MLHVWRYFEDLTAARPPGLAPVPISYTEIDCYARLMRVRISPLEARLIRSIDDLAIKHAPKPRGATLKNETAPEDGAGVGELMRGLSAQRKRQAKGEGGKHG